jgi:hypothetical protein
MKKVFYSLLAVSMIGLTIVCCEEKGNDGNQGNGGYQGTISGRVISNSSCKSFMRSGVPVDEVPDTISRVEYSYDNETKKLTLKHINANFNCCADSLYCEIELKGDTIMIEEFEESAICNCICMYDLEIEVDSVEMKGYQVKFIERYVGDQEKLVFGIDLAAAASGSYSVIRK